jgi:hypothetical protein
MQGNWYGVWAGTWFGDGGDEEPGAMSGAASFTISATGTLSKVTQEQGGGAAPALVWQAPVRIARLNPQAEPEQQPRVVQPAPTGRDAEDLAQDAIARAMESARQEEGRIAAVLGQIEAESKAAQAAAATAEIAAMLDAIEAEQERTRRQNNRNRAAILAALMLLD